LKTEEIRELVRRWEDLEASGIFEKGKTRQLKKKFLLCVVKDENSKPFIIFNGLPYLKFERGDNERLQS
jgi:hypothetical protein